MKTKTKTLGILLCLIATIIGISNIEAYDNKVTFHKRDLNGVNIASGTTTLFKYVKTSYSDKVTAYCMNHKKIAPSSGKKLSFKKDITTKELQYIFQNGYSLTKAGYNKTIMGDNLSKDEAYYATQMAVWLYQGSIAKKQLKTNSKEGKAAIALFEAAKSAPNSSTAVIDIASPDTHMTEATYNGTKVYKSQLLTVSGNGYNSYKITLTGAPTGSKIIDANNNEVALNIDITTPTSFYLIMPKDISPDSVTVSVSAKSTTIKVLKYTTGSGSYQDVGIPYEETVDINDSITLYVSKTVEKGNLRIVKVDATDANNMISLNDVQIQVTNAANEIIATWTTNSSNNPYVINDLPIGVYTITELSAPADYAKANTVTVTTKSNETIEVVLKNYKNTTTSIKISKQDITTKEELAGASLNVKDVQGNVIDTWVSSTTPHYLYNLQPGKYQLIETLAPQGYGISDEIVEFTVLEDGTVDGTVVMYNSALPNTADVDVVVLAVGTVFALGFLIFTTVKFNKQQA